jgi:hypothetical protein
MSKNINQLNRLSIFARHHSDPRTSFLPSTFRPLTEPRRMRWLGLLLIFHFSLLISACGLDIEDPTPPSPPVWVQKSLPEEWPERGIDAHETGGIYLEWEPNPEENIAAYLIYRAQYFDYNDSLGDFALLFKLSTGMATSLDYVDAECVPRIRYYYKIRAEDMANNESAFSNSAAYSLLPQISINLMVPNGISESLNQERILNWHYTNSIEMENYCLTVSTQYDDLIFRVVLTPMNYVSGWEFWQIPDSIFLPSNQSYKWRVDVGANYVNGLEALGSESQWATFSYSAE